VKTTALDYVGSFGGSLLLAWVLTPLMLRIAARFAIFDHPDGHKSHTTPVPYLGGVAIVLAFASAVGVAGAIYRPVHVFGDLVVVLGLGSALAVMGLVDDLRGLSPILRLAVEIGAGVGVWRIGSGVQLPGPRATDLLITVLWVVGVTNAFNLLDNMDGLSAGIAAIGAASFFTLAALNGQHLVATLAVAVAGCAIGFLWHNFHPAKIYMGDAGSLFLGFLLSVLGLRLRLPDAPQLSALFVPIVVLGVALFDTTLVTIGRLWHGRPVMQGGRDHTSHRLVWIGLPVPAGVGLLYAAATTLGWVAVVISRIDQTSAVVLAGLVFAIGLALLVLLHNVPVYENSRIRRRMIRLVREHESGPVRDPSVLNSPEVLQVDATVDASS
jgi:UDP-GlcNAc:undecaprenyl-phosphate/decaprenyl-phosphate GlcNAc-1-phosphate transferase